MKKIGLKTKKIELIPNGINLSKFNNNLIKKENFFYLAVGRLEKEKNHEMLIKAFSKFLNSLNNKLNKPILKIVGEGSQKENLKNLIKNLNMQNNIELLGVRKDIPELLKSSDIYLLTSKWEGLSISLMEAAASGLPIIASNVGSNFLICQNNINGWLFENENEEELIKLFLKIENASIEKIQNFSRNSREISKNYDLQKNINKLINLYEDTIIKR